MKEVRAAVIGVGSMGRNHARVYSELEGVQLVGVADSNSQVGEALAQQHQTTYFADSAEMLRELRPDVVSVVVPTSLHLEVGLIALQHAKVVLMEKPIALNEDEATRLTREAKRLGKIMTIGHIERYNPAVQVARSLICSAEIGFPLQMTFRRQGPKPERVVDLNIIEDIGIHDIDLARYFLEDEPIRVSAEGGIWQHRTINYASIQLGYEPTVGHPTVVDIVVSWVNATKVRKIDINGSTGYLSVDLIGRPDPGQKVPRPRVTVSDQPMIYHPWESYEEFQAMLATQSVRQIEVPRIEPLAAELLEAVKAARGEPANLVKPEEATSALQIAKRAVSDIRMKNRQREG